MPRQLFDTLFAFRESFRPLPATPGGLEWERLAVPLAETTYDLSVAVEVLDHDAHSRAAHAADGSEPQPRVQLDVACASDRYDGPALDGLMRRYVGLLEQLVE